MTTKIKMSKTELNEMLAKLIADLPTANEIHREYLIKAIVQLKAEIEEAAE